MLEVLYATGIRRSELAHLAVFDLDVDRQTLLVRQGKGKRDRMVPIGQRALAWLARYLATARPVLVVEPDDGALFVSADGIAFSPDRLTQIVGGYVTASGVGKQGACHLFRHTMATLMLEGGADIRYIQAMLGHAELSTTQIYTQVSIRALQAVHAATHPAASNTRLRSPNNTAPSTSTAPPPPTAPPTGRLPSSTAPGSASPSTEPAVVDDGDVERPDGDGMTELLAVLAEEIDQENRVDPGSADPSLRRSR